MQNEMFFDGDDYVHQRDTKRLGKQIDQIRIFMEGKDYLTLQEISDATGHPHSSVSAQIRNLRKDRFGGRVVQRKYNTNGLYSYKLMPNNNENES